MASNYNSPRKEDARLPLPRGDLFEDQIARNLEYHIADLKGQCQLSLKLPRRLLRLSRQKDEAYKVNGLNPIILIRCHAQLCQDVARLSNLQDLDGCSVGIVDLLHEVHESHQRQETQVNLAHDTAVIIGGKSGEEVFSICLIIHIAMGLNGFGVGD